MGMQYVLVGMAYLPITYAKATRIFKILKVLGGGMSHHHLNLFPSRWGWLCSTTLHERFGQFLWATVNWHLCCTDTVTLLWARRADT